MIMEALGKMKKKAQYKPFNCLGTPKSLSLERDYCLLVVRGKYHFNKFVQFHSGQFYKPECQGLTIKSCGNYNTYYKVHLD